MLIEEQNDGGVEELRPLPALGSPLGPTRLGMDTGRSHMVERHGSIMETAQTQMEGPGGCAG